MGVCLYIFALLCFRYHTDSPILYVNAGHLFKLLGWKYLQSHVSSQQEIQRTMMVYNSQYGLAPEYLSYKFERRETAYNPRDSENKLNVPLPHINYYKNRFNYSGAILWDGLPCELGEVVSHSKRNNKARYIVFVESSFTFFHYICY